ncbi:MAG: RDD family protein [Cyclobacteriaceae bacterium]|nr:RDD family protein [Cyclobacteriaceae bacterium]
MYEIIDAPEREERTLNYAGFWIRVAAYLIDSVVLWLVNVVVSYIIFQSYSIYQSNLTLSLVSIVIAATYFALMESSERQGTLCKITVGVKS